MSPVDLIFAIILILAMLRGYTKGLVGTAATYIAPVLAFMIAQDWSDPVRDKLAELVPAADFFVDLLAPVVVFIAVVIVIRLFAAIIARVLGVGLSMPSRIIAGAATVAVGAIILGAFILLVHEFRPRGRIDVDGGPDPNATPIENTLVNLDRELSESFLAPHLEQIASIVVSEAMSRTQATPLVRPEIRDEIERAAQRATDTAVDAAVEKLKNPPPPGKPTAKPDDAKPESATATKQETRPAEKPATRAADRPAPAAGRGDR